MKALTIPMSVCDFVEELTPLGRERTLRFIFEYRLFDIKPDLSGECEFIQLAWRCIEKKFERLDKEAGRKRNVRGQCAQELPPSPEREKSPHTPLKEKATSSSQETLDQTLFDLWFSDFWKAYPRKVGKSAAEKKFRAILRKSKEPIALVEKMIAAVKEQTVKLEWIDRPQYCPHPSTWLNQARWEDEVVEFGPERGRTPRRADNFIATPREDLEEVF